MKLKNKKTGEIIDDGYVRETHDFQFDGQKHVLAVFKGNGHRPPERVSGAYSSLAELYEEWEDAPEEPKKAWFIDAFGNICDREAMTLKLGWDDKPLFEFETKEEAEKAVEKLKAWKRLKDKGFRFDHIRSIDGVTLKHKDLDQYTIIAHADEDGCDQECLDLLFGGEE